MTTIPDELNIIINTSIPGYQKLKYSPSMTIPGSSGAVNFNPLFKLKTNTINEIPDFLRTKSFFSKGLFDSLIKFSGGLTENTLENAKYKGYIDNNIQVTLDNIFPPNSILYINSKPFVIVDYQWTRGNWALDTKKKPRAIDTSKITNPLLRKKFEDQEIQEGYNQIKALAAKSPDIIKGNNFNSDTNPVSNLGAGITGFGFGPTASGLEIAIPGAPDVITSDVENKIDKKLADLLDKLHSSNNNDEKKILEELIKKIKTELEPIDEMKVQLQEIQKNQNTTSAPDNKIVLFQQALTDKENALEQKFDRLSQLIREEYASKQQLQIEGPTPIQPNTSEVCTNLNFKKFEKDEELTNKIKEFFYQPKMFKVIECLISSSSIKDLINNFIISFNQNTKSSDNAFKSTVDKLTIVTKPSDTQIPNVMNINSFQKSSSYTISSPEIKHDIDNLCYLISYAINHYNNDKKKEERIIFDNYGCTETFTQEVISSIILNKGSELIGSSTDVIINSVSNIIYKLFGVFIIIFVYNGTNKLTTINEDIPQDIKKCCFVFYSVEDNKMGLLTYQSPKNEYITIVDCDEIKLIKNSVPNFDIFPPIFILFLLFGIFYNKTSVIYNDRMQDISFNPTIYTGIMHILKNSFNTIEKNKSNTKYKDCYDTYNSFFDFQEKSSVKQTSKKPTQTPIKTGRILRSAKGARGLTGEIVAYKGADETTKKIDDIQKAEEEEDAHPNTDLIETTLRKGFLNNKSSSDPTTNGNLCYIISVLQMLFSIEEFVNYLDNPEESSMTESMTALKNIYDLYKSTNASPIQIADDDIRILRSLIADGGCSQQDSVEFLTKLLNQSDTQLFDYKTIKTYTCDNKYTTIEGQPEGTNKILTVGILNSDNISDISELVRDSLIENVDSKDDITLALTKLDSLNTTCEVNSLKQESFITTVNDYLLVQVQSSNDSQNVSYTDLEIPIKTLIDNNVTINVEKYKIKGCIVHRGVTGDTGGHYVYYDFDENGRPKYLFDDADVYLESNEKYNAEEIKTNGYLFLYKRVISKPPILKPFSDTNRMEDIFIHDKPISEQPYGTNNHEHDQTGGPENSIGQTGGASNSQIAFQITIDMELYPGKSIPPEFLSELQCKHKWNAVRKAFYEFIGKPYFIKPVYEQYIEINEKEKALKEIEKEKEKALKEKEKESETNSIISRGGGNKTKKNRNKKINKKTKKVLYEYYE